MSIRPRDRQPTSDLPSAEQPADIPAELRGADEQDLLQIRDRLEWTPEDRLSHLRDMIAFEELARTTRRV